jgi:hypothetical protein
MDYDDAPAEPMTADDLRKIGKKWLDRIKEADKRERPWFEQAERATDAFAAKEGGKVYDFNILHSNIATIGPAVYNSMPIPDVRERFRTGSSNPETAAARAVAQVIERAILVQ